MIIYFVCLLFWILFSVCCVADGENSKSRIPRILFYYFSPPPPPKKNLRNRRRAGGGVRGGGGYPLSSSKYLTRRAMSADNAHPVFEKLACFLILS